MFTNLLVIFTYLLVIFHRLRLNFINLLLLTITNYIYYELILIIKSNKITCLTHNFLNFDL